MYLREYIQKYKDEKLTADTFALPDGALLSMFTLADIPNICPTNKAIKFRDAMKKQVELHKMRRMGLILPTALTKALYEASQVRRYYGLKIHDVFYLVDEKECTQSIFLQMDMIDNTTVVVFSGTDDTLIGWRENFDIVYGKRVPCLKHAVEYANKLRTDRKYIFVGHSKGGMEVLYAGLMCKPEVQKCIISINDYDGTGYPLEVLNEMKDSLALSKATLVVPNEGTVGRFFYHPINPKIVYSNELGLLQHNPLTWRIKGKDFDFVDSFTMNSESFSVMITSTPDKFTKEELESFEKALFEDTLGVGGTTKLIEIPSKIFDIQKAFMGLSLQNKRLYLKFMKHLIEGRLITRDMLLTTAKVKWNPFSKNK
ncbi:MAG: DUF2974 domain-containing protein [Bacilli bacterium]|nr:DUF2974 domain-containing protein [Bacilli bacterium]